MKVIQQRRWGAVALVCVSVFAAAYVVGTFTNYPEWVWPLVFVGLIGSVAVGLPAVALLVWDRARRRPA